MGASGAGRSSAAFRRWRRAVRGDCCWVRFMEPVFVLDVAFMEFVTTLLWRAVCQKKEKKKKNTWKPDAIKLLICTSVTLTNAVTTTGHEMDQRRCYSFFFFFFFFFFLVFCLITIVVMQIVLNSCKLLVFKRYAMKRLRRLYSTVNVSESSHGDSSTHQIIHGDEAADGSSLHWTPVC